MSLLSRIKRYYLFWGPEEFLKTRRIKSLISSVIKKGYEDFDINYFEGRGLDAATLINMASSPPLGSPLRVVVLRNLEKVSPKGQGLIMRFIGSIPEYATLVMTCVKVDRRKSIFKTLMADKTACHFFGQLTTGKAAKLVAETANDIQARISAESIAYLVETVGPDIGRLEQELVKLSLYVGPEATIQKADVAQMCGAGTMGTISDLPQKISTGDIQGALVLLDNLLLAKQAESRILFKLKDYFIKLNMVKALNASPALLSRMQGLLQKTAVEITGIARRLSEHCIVNCLFHIYKCEIALKSAGLRKDVVLYDLIARLGLEIQAE